MKAVHSFILFAKFGWLAVTVWNKEIFNLIFCQEKSEVTSYSEEKTYWRVSSIFALTDLSKDS